MFHVSRTKKPQAKQFLFKAFYSGKLGNLALSDKQPKSALPMAFLPCLKSLCVYLFHPLVFRMPQTVWNLRLHLGQYSAAGLLSMLQLISTSLPSRSAPMPSCLPTHGSASQPPSSAPCPADWFAIPADQCSQAICCLISTAPSHSPADSPLQIATLICHFRVW